MLDRRRFLRNASIFSAGLALPLSVRSLVAQSKQAARGTADRHFEVRNIKRTTVKLPFRETPGRAMAREIPHWDLKEIFEVELASGKVGIGETTHYYTYQTTEEWAVRRALNRNAMELMWDDWLGAGLQMALFDAVAKTADVPLHRLLGPKIYNRTPLSWWNIDTPAADMAAECKLAYESGYLAYKTKGRPWFDIWKQMDAASAVVPDHFKIDMDFNDTLRDAERAIPILQELKKRYPQIDIFETPIPQSDVPGGSKITAATDVKIAYHYGKPDPAICVRERVCDGFVLGGGASELMRSGAFAAQAEMPFWLQVTGSDITAAWSLHFGGVFSHAEWPAVDCHQLFANRLLTEPIVVKEGFAAVPNEKPGIGFELDRDVMEKFKVEKPKSRPEPKRLLETSWPDGEKMYVGSNGKVNYMISIANEEGMPFYKDGADTRLVPDDGTKEWADLYQAARRKPVYR